MGYIKVKSKLNTGCLELIEYRKQVEQTMRTVLAAHANFRILLTQHNVRIIQNINVKQGRNHRKSLHHRFEEYLFNKVSALL